MRSAIYASLLLYKAPENTQAETKHFMWQDITTPSTAPWFCKEEAATGSNASKYTCIVCCMQQQKLATGGLTLTQHVCDEPCGRYLKRLVLDPSPAAIVTVACAQIDRVARQTFVAATLRSLPMHLQRPPRHCKPMVGQTLGVLCSSTYPHRGSPC